MNLVSVVLPLLAFVTSVAAQASHIGYPTAGTQIQPGQSLSVQVVKDVSIMGSIEVGLVLSLQYCPPPNACPNPVNELGFVLYTGKWTQTGQNPRQGEMWDNITVTIPDYDFQFPAPARLIETRFHLIGGGPAAVLETNTVDLQLVD
ncbi:hypothetical protein D9756_006101 [Leucocoprinus leucothites]|uniref:Uncharacterized protein n=1 Tax=Leucocoprinus leucothites TaxID=201217 RepID=A0A8H5D528_9AGAR|nr:hypothetical protein D9756_006101 [Leucoagaricus leucothites]